jgi:hypothetical protein
MSGKRSWLIGDGYLPVKSRGEHISHESVCVLNLTDQDAVIQLTIYFEDREPMKDLLSFCKAQRTHHIRLDRITDQAGNIIPRGVPYAIQVDSDIPVIVQHTRLDTTQKALSLMTVMAYPNE